MSYSLRYIVNSSTRPWIASKYSPRSHRSPANHTILLNRPKAVGATAWVITTHLPVQWRDYSPPQKDEGDECVARDKHDRSTHEPQRHRVHALFHCSTHLRISSSIAEKSGTSASGRNRNTTSPDKLPTLMSVRATARARRLNEFLTTACPLFAVTMIPTRGVSEMTR